MTAAPHVRQLPTSCSPASQALAPEGTTLRVYTEPSATQRAKPCTGAVGRYYISTAPWAFLCTEERTESDESIRTREVGRIK